MKLLPNKRQWNKWTLVSKAGYIGAWFGGLGLLITIVVLVWFLPSGPIQPPPRPRVDVEFEQLLFQADEYVHKPFDKWFRPSVPGQLDCDEGSRIQIRALQLVEKITTLSTRQLQDFSTTRAMAKYEYIAMLNCWAAAIADTCRQIVPDSEAQVLFHASRVLANYDTVSTMREIIFAQGTDMQDYFRSLDVAMDIDNITSWYAARAACILFLRGHYQFADAYGLAQRAHALFPTECDPWIDHVNDMAQKNGSEQ